MPTASTASDDFAARLERVREAGVLRFDLTEADPERSGLGWDPRELEALLGGGQGSAAGGAGRGLTEAREAVASYLAGHRVRVRPDHVFFAPSRSEARRLAVAAVCAPDDEVLVPAPARPLVDPAGNRPRVRARPYALAFEEEWRLDLKSVRRAVGPGTRAVFVGNPAEPAGALLAGDELEALDELCGVRSLALVGDEAFLDATIAPSASVARATRCLAVHVSGLSGVCGLPRLGGEWLAVAGPDALAAPVAARLTSLTEGAPPVPESTLRAIPALLARREPFLGALRARLARNRGAIAAASLREAPWTLLWGGGGCWAVLQVNPVRDETELCLELLDEGIAVQPGHLDGLPSTGYLVVSLLPRPEVVVAGLERLEKNLRRID
jgi:aspartate/methionine/tyrosine aminotransferase